MSFIHVGWVLFILGILTSLIDGKKNDTSGSKIKIEYEEILIAFKQPLDTSDPIQDSEVFEEVKELQPNTTYYLKVEAIPTWSFFIVFQAHAYLHNVTLGYNTAKVANKYVTGQNVGLVQNTTAAATAEFFLEHENPFNVSVLLAIIAYNKSVPVPGGCNMEFEVETAPWLRVNVTGPAILVSSQPARPPRVSGGGAVCDMPALQYEAYHYYLPETDFLPDTYFTHIRNMLTVGRIRQNGREVKESAMGKMQYMYSAYHGTGTVFAVVVRDTMGHGAAYVPALTYSCSPARYTDTCQVLTSTFSRSLCALALFLGLFVCFYGHSFFQTELFLFTTLMGSILFYVLVTHLKLTDSANMMLAVLGGVTLGNFWLLLWWTSGSPLVSIIMATVSLAYLLTCVLFYSALADVPVMESNEVYWLGFLCCMLLVAMLVAPQTTRVNLLACSVVGAYVAVVSLDHYFGANLKYIFINTMRRATVPGFNEAIIDPPYQTKDGVLTTVWVLLAVAGYVTQMQRFGEKPLFPRPHLWGTPPNPAPRQAPEERAPLLTPASDNVFS